MDNNSVKANITIFRKQLHLTQQEMAEKMGISRNAYRRIETGETALLNDYILQIASILKKTPDELVLGYAPPENGGGTLDELRAEYRMKGQAKEQEYEERIRTLNQTINDLEKRIRLLEDLVNTKEEIITMLKKDRQR